METVFIFAMSYTYHVVNCYTKATKNFLNLIASTQSNNAATAVRRISCFLFVLGRYPETRVHMEHNFTCSTNNHELITKLAFGFLL